MWPPSARGPDLSRLIVSVSVIAGLGSGMAEMSLEKLFNP